ncbi:MAG: molecular chaperone HtpG [Spirochaetales bacterium]|uniref:Chaperone protein HtpG n=1 Tax=Candidatus Thalassospirochaeta sargassi TaxID=3119039 RepID=A0AAJ1MJG9_9SPIO|nr:molecular chaperone HtpG [Spirochaetales bacterium]
MSKKKFKTEISQLLDLIIHSLYSHKEIFLRELISNSSDALDKLKYLTLTDDELKQLDFDPRIDINFDADAKLLTLSDNGIGMNAEDLDANLGTIARSGTKNFLSQLSGDAQKDSNLIGQFGVGFYSCFMVADKVTVISRKAGEEQAWKWQSDGRTNYSVDESERESQGTTVQLHLNDNGTEYTNRWSIEQLVKKYSDHIAFPIFLEFDDVSFEGEGDDRKEVKEHKIEQINTAAAIWKKSKSDLSDEDYNEFYKTIGHDNEDPMLHLHTKAEGTQEYTTLFYVPAKAPFDMYQADYKPGVKLYIKRVFITDDEKELMPVYLRFLRGVIDSEDLPLNVSREILQQNRVLEAIKSASVKKVLGEFKKIAENNPEKYKEFIEQYNRPLKEGVYSDYANRETLLELIRYKSSEEEGWTSLAAYKERMKDDQKGIYYITGDNESTLRNSPLLEAYKKKGIEVLIMDDEIDEIVAPSIMNYKDVELKAVNKSGAADDLKTEEDEEKEKDLEPILKRIKDVLGDKVKEVKASSRLSDSPSCIVADENDPTMQMQQMMRAMGQTDMPDIVPILEINPDHAIVSKLKASSDDAVFEDVSFLLFEQAMLVEGQQLKEPAEFVKRLNRVMENAV